jgi:hypothetical protein
MREELKAKDELLQKMTRKYDLSQKKNRLLKAKVKGLERGQELLEEACDKTIDKIIYDFKNQTCENCKHYKEKYNDVDWRTDTKMKCVKFNLFPTKDFGCNQWESKQ